MSNDTCRVEECNRPVKNKTRQLCNAHYLQFMRGKPFTEPRNRAIGECAFDGCGRPIVSKGHCGGHYQQRIKGYELRKLNRAKHALSKRDENGNKECQTCLEWKDVSAFGNRKSSSDGLTGKCKECTRKDHDPKQSRVRMLARKYGLTIAQYEEMESNQDGACAICGTRDSGSTAWHIDHDHSCCGSGRSCGKCVRGLLCRHCNQALGLAREDVEILDSMISYIGRWKSKRKVHDSVA